MVPNHVDLHSFGQVSTNCNGHNVRFEAKEDSSKEYEAFGATVRIGKEPDYGWFIQVTRKGIACRAAIVRKILLLLFFYYYKLNFLTVQPGYKIRDLQQENI